MSNSAWKLSFGGSGTHLFIQVVWRTAEDIGTQGFHSHVGQRERAFFIAVADPRVLPPRNVTYVASCSQREVFADARLADNYGQTVLTGHGAIKSALELFYPVPLPTKTGR